MDFRYGGDKVKFYIARRLVYIACGTTLIFNFASIRIGRPIPIQSNRHRTGSPFTLVSQASLSPHPLRGGESLGKLPYGSRIARSAVGQLAK